MLRQRLERWVAAGLIDAAQADQILAHEDRHGKPRLLHAVVGLAGLAIAIGIVSIVASNWDVIPGRAKIAVDLLLVAALGVTAVRFDRTGPRWAHEVTILVLYGLVLASIALIGQVYQLGGSARVAMTLWSVLTFLLMTRARSGFVALVWLIGLQTTYALWLVWLADRGGDVQAGLMVGGISWAPLLCIAVGRVPAISRRRPAPAKVFEVVGWAEIVLCASLATAAFYEDFDSSLRPGLAIGLFIAATLSAWIWVALGRSVHSTALRVLLVSCLALAFGTLLLSPGELDVGGAIAFILLWLVVAYAAHTVGDARLVNGATAVVGIRILTVYFEVFGSLLGTGIGLVVGGALTLGLVWVWLRLRRRLAPESLEEAR